MAETSAQILDLAERAMRLRGYHAVSFRDLADDMGIKSASIHYHFRRKEDLGLAVADRYATRVGEALGDPTDLTWSNALNRFCGVYRETLQDQDLQCLCGMLAAESLGLPDIVSDRVAEFYEANIAWLMAAMPRGVSDKRVLALGIQSEVQGAVTLSISLRDPGILDQVAARIVSDATG